MPRATEKKIIARASSKATTDSRVVVRAPFALYSRIMARITAGAVALASAPITNPIGR